LDDVHSAYVAMAASGRVTSSQRIVFDSACEQLIQEAKVDAIMLGGTDLALVYDERQTDFPLVDCAAIHVKAVVRTVAS
jgi:aspartate racemase